MQYKLLGFSPTKFNGDNGSVEGFNLYFCAPLQGEGCKGAYSFRQFVLKGKCPILEIGAAYDLEFRRGNGKLESIRKA